MHKFTDDELDFILNDIQANGVEIEDLQLNLLDHICCIIENEKSDNEDFYTFYAQILPRFFTKELKEIQEETENLLTFKNYYAMKNTLKITGIASALLTITGATLKVLHLPGAAIIIVLGGVLFSLLFLPLMILLKFKDEEKTIDKLVLSFGFLIAMFAFMGVVFKLMHWPYANILMLSGISTFVFVYVPLYFFTRVRRPELKFNATINSVLMMACGGLLFALFNLGYSTKFTQQNDEINARLKSNIHELYKKEKSELSTSKDSNDLILLKQSDLLFRKLDQFVDELQSGNAFDDKSFTLSVDSYNKVLKASFPESSELMLNSDLLSLKQNNLIQTEQELRYLQLQLVLNIQKL